MQKSTPKKRARKGVLFCAQIPGLDHLVFARFLLPLSSLTCSLQFPFTAFFSLSLPTFSVIPNSTSALNPEMLNKKYDEAKFAVAEKRTLVESLEGDLANSRETMRQVKRQYNDVMSWADMYSESPIDVKKMIVAQLIGAVRVSKDYHIEIDFKISERQLGLEQEQESVRELKQRKRRDEPAL